MDALSPLGLIRARPWRPQRSRKMDAGMAVPARGISPVYVVEGVSLC